MLGVEDQLVNAYNGIVGLNKKKRDNVVINKRDS